MDDKLINEKTIEIKNFEIKKRHIILLIIFLLYFIIRVYFSLQTPYLDDDSSYYSLRQIENIIEKGKPILKDNLSYGSRNFYFMPFYYYFIGILTKFFLLILPNIDKIVIIKVLNNFFASLLIISIYVLVTHIQKNRNISLICSLLAASFPLYINETFNKLNYYSIFFPILFFLIYLFIRIEKEKISLLILVTILLILTTNNAVILLVAFIIYYILNYFENTEIEKIKKEYIIFFILLYFWANFIIFKNAILINKYNFIWQNTPKILLENYFLELDIYSLITNIGLLQIFFSTYTIYNYIVNKKNKNILFIISIFFSIIIFLIIKIIPYKLGILFLGCINIILFGVFWGDFFSTFKKTKLFNHESKAYFLLIFGLIVFQLIPSILLLSKENKTSYYENFKLLKNIEDNSAIISLPEEGHLITYFGNKKNIIDTEFLGIENIDDITKDVFNLYRIDKKIDNLNIIEKYNANYILFTKKTKLYNITEKNFIIDCFNIIYNITDFRLYEYNETKCKIKTI